MAEEFNTGTSWWDSSRPDGSSSSSSSSSGLNNSLGSFGWATEMADMKTTAAAARSSMDSVSSVSGSSVVFQDNPKLQIGPNHGDLHLMGLGLSSQAMDNWNQALLREDKSESSFRSMLQDHNLNNSNPNYHQDQTCGIGSSQVLQWRNNEFKQISRSGFCLDQSSQFSDPHGSSTDSTVTNCQGLPSSNFQMDSTASLYGNPTILQGLLGSENQEQQQQQQSSYENRSNINYQYGAASASYGMNINDQFLPNSWSKVPQFLRNSPPKQQQKQQQNLHGHQLHFSNNAPFWNPSEAASMSDHVRPGSFFPSILQTQFATGNFDEKTKKNISKVRDSSTVVKKSGNEATSKRPKNETPSTLPAFKVRKEKVGDRITALQQLVSPFGKTDTASVLSEAIEYIKFLHQQVLSTPYMKIGAAIQQQQNSEKCKDSEAPKQDLRSRGLCLVPVSGTFPVTHEPTVDFWTPTYGGTFR